MIVTFLSRRSLEAPVPREGGWGDTVTLPIMEVLDVNALTFPCELMKTPLWFYDGEPRQISIDGGAFREAVCTCGRHFGGQWVSSEWAKRVTSASAARTTDPPKPPPKVDVELQFPPADHETERLMRAKLALTTVLYGRVGTVLGTYINRLLEEAWTAGWQARGVGQTAIIPLTKQIEDLGAIVRRVWAGWELQPQDQTARTTKIASPEEGDTR